MRMTTKTIRAMLPFIAAAAWGQTAEQPRRNTYRIQGTPAARNRLISPEVHQDRRITFRVNAPKAAEVALTVRRMEPEASADDQGCGWCMDDHNRTGGA